MLAINSWSGRKLSLNRLVVVFLVLILFQSTAFAAPHIFRSKPEPIEHIGTPLKMRMFAIAPQGAMFAPGSYPATVRILLLRVDFPPDADDQTTGTGDWDDPEYFHEGDPDYWVNKAKTNFINYWKEVSYDNLLVSMDTSTLVYQLPNTLAVYGSESFAALENLTYDSIIAANADTDPATKIDFSLYDAVLIVHAGTGEESDINGDSSSDIWSLYYADDCISPDDSGTGCLTTTLKNGTVIKEIIFMPQTDSQDGYTIDPLGVYVHEFGHWLGLPDLYCTLLLCIPDGAGKWSLMGDGIYNADPADCPVQGPGCLFGNSPAHLDAWSKVFLGWVTPVTSPPPTDLGSHVFSPVENSPDIVKIQASSSTADQYFLMENRQLSGYDKGLPGHGLLVWLIDDVVINNNIGSNTVNNNPFRPGVKLIEADNDWKLLSYGCSAEGEDCGSPGDPFPGSTSNTSLTLHSLPPSTAYSPAAWVSVKNIVETGPTDTTVTAEIGFAPLPPGTPGMHGNTISWPAAWGWNIVSYNVYRNKLQIGQTTELSFIDPEARSGDGYQVTAVDSGGDESDFSGTVIANIVMGDGGGGDSRCFVATAAYGSYLDPRVEILRGFRDRYLLTNEAGRKFVSFYYRYSPSLAVSIRKHEPLRAITRWALTPMIYAALHPVVFMLLILTGAMLLGRGILLMLPRR
jgi:M6 family metalloprotease-like protein